ncbi:MAG: hypothetical protein IPM77_16730, partial [Crocinitomicaceae bacterium]|nr:hypothetical protein [Crocinitomicaceae bacterium]
MKIEQGIISKFDKVKKFDKDGDEYSEIYLTVNNQKFFSKAPADTYLSEGVTIYFERENNEITSCYAPLDGTKWGKNAGALKRTSPSEDKYSFVKGKVIEKQKRTTLNTTDSAITGRTFERG